MFKHINFIMIGVVVCSSGVQAAEKHPPITKGQVLCVSLKDAKKYQGYQFNAPAFARDLLDRAACYISAGPESEIYLGQEEGHQKYQLLSGQRVWTLK